MGEYIKIFIYSDESVEENTVNAYGEFEVGVKRHGRSYAVRDAAEEPGAGGEARHERSQYHGGGVGGMAEYEIEFAAPKYFIAKPAESRNEKNKI